MVHRGRARMRSPMRKASAPVWTTAPARNRFPRWSRNQLRWRESAGGGGGRGLQLDGERGPGGFDDKIDLRRAFLGAEVVESAALAAEGDLGAELPFRKVSKN